MKHLEALLIKFAFLSIVLELVFLNFSGLTFGRVLFVALTVTVLAYIIGDVLILPRTSNLVASLVDFGLAFVTLFVFGLIYNKSGIAFITVLLASIAVAVCEWIYHIVLRRIFERPHEKFEKEEFHKS